MKEKKWLRKTTALCAAAVLGAAAVPSAAFGADSYSAAEKEAWAKSVAEFTSAYAESMTSSETLMSGAQADISLKLEDSGRSLLGFLVPDDISWADSLVLSTTSSFVDGKEGILMKVLLNDTQICTIEYYLDPETQDIFMKIPELSDKYIKVNLKEAAEIQAKSLEEATSDLSDDLDSAVTASSDFMEGYSAGLNASVSLFSDLSASMPEGSVLEELLNKYGTLIFDNVAEGESSQDTLTAGDVSADCTVYEGQITLENGVKMANAILSEAKSDKELEGILSNWAQLLPDSEDLYDQFIKAIDTGLDSLKDVDTSDTDSYLSTRIWVDGNGDIAGRELGIHEGDTDTPILTWKMPKADSDFGYLLSVTADDSSFELSGSGKIENDKLNGTYTFSQDSSPVVNIEVKDYDVASEKEGNLNGTYTITFAEDIANEDASALQNFALIMDIASAKDTGSISLSVTSGGSTLGTLSITSGAGETVDIPDLSSITESYSAYDEDAMTAYAATMDFTEILSNLSDAGVPDEVITSILSGGSSDTEQGEEDSTETDGAAETDSADDTENAADAA